MKLNKGLSTFRERALRENPGLRQVGYSRDMAGQIKAGFGLYNRKCPLCGGTKAGNFRTCPNCRARGWHETGVPPNHVNRCTECGTKIHLKYLRCRSCHYELRGGR